MRREYQRKANGKFMITSEYMALRGADVLALPLKFGQSALLVPHDGEAIYWESFAPSGKWFETALHTDSLAVLNGADTEKSQRLVNIITEIRKQNPDFLKNGWWVRTDLDFDPAFGMGSSSTLLSLLCDAAGADWFPVLKNTFGGSGYDLACAFAEKPIIYNLGKGNPSFKTVELSQPVTDHILFVYSGNKMVSSGEVKKFSSVPTSEALVERFNALTQTIVDAQDVKTLCESMAEHESKIAELLDQPVLQKRFPDFEGAVKSMGAWGGDFFMVVAEDVEKARAYFSDKNFSPIYTYKDIVFGV